MRWNEPNRPIFIAWKYEWIRSLPLQHGFNVLLIRVQSGIEPAHCKPMIARRTQLLLLAALLLGLVHTVAFRSLKEVPARVCEPEDANLHSLQQRFPEPERLSVLDIPVAQPAPDPVEEKTPVETVKERDDALVFEAEALFGTPFDQAVVMPFD